MFGLGAGIAQGGHRIRPVGQITADFIKDRYRGGIGPGFFDLFDFVAAGNRTYRDALGTLCTAGPNEPRTGHHVYKGGKWVPVGLLLEPGTIQYVHYTSDIVGNWSHTGAVLSNIDNDFVRINSTGSSAFPRAEVLGLTAAAGTFTPQLEVRQGNTDTVILRIAGAGIGGGAETNSTYLYRFSTGLFTKRNGGTSLDPPQVTEVQPGVFLFWFTQEVTTVDKMSLYPIWNNTEADLYVDFRYPQLTPGRVPNSFISNPTGAPMARAGDSLEISALTIAKLLVKHNREENMVTVGNWDPEQSWTYDDGVLIHAPTHTKNAVQTDIGVEADEFYLIGYEIFESDQGGFVTVRLGDKDTNLDVTSPNNNGFYSHLVTANGVDDSFGVRCGIALSAKFRNIELHKVTMPTRYVQEVMDLNPSENWTNPAPNVFRRTGSAGWQSASFVGATDRVGTTARVRGRIKRLAGGAKSNAVNLYFRNEANDNNDPEVILWAATSPEVWLEFDVARLLRTGGQGVLWFDSNGSDFEIELYEVSTVIQDLTLFMEGLVSHGNDGDEVIGYDWPGVGADRIAAFIVDTAGSAGQFRAIQFADAKLDEASDIGAFPVSGLHEPFSIATSHTNGSVNGAFNNVVLTKNTNVDALPYLVGLPIALVPKGIVTVSKFSLFLGASGDDLLEELVR